MAHEIGQHMRRAVLRDVFRRRARDTEHRAEPRGHETGIRQIVGEHDRHVVALVEQVGHALRER